VLIELREALRRREIYVQGAGRWRNPDAAYEAQCAVSRSIAASHELTDTAPHPELGQVSLRWIYVHMIDETARHAGHADILREQLEAQEETTGDPDP
jgi:hypothetical protein